MKRKISIELSGLLIFIGVTLLSFNVNINTGLDITKWYVGFGTAPIFWGLVIGLFPIIWNHAYEDAQKNFINHTPRFIIRAIIAFIISFLIVGSFSLNLLWMVIFLGAYFWLSFDLIYNLHRGNEITYIGNTPMIDKFIGRVFGRNILGFIIINLLKLTLMVLSIYKFIF